MKNYARDEDSQDIYLEVTISVTDARPAAREAPLQVRRREGGRKRRGGHFRLFSYNPPCMVYSPSLPPSLLPSLVRHYCPRPGPN